jgi:hypothetical protein
MNTVLGYGRYADDPTHIGCPRARTDMSACVARDGSTATLDDATCAGCRADPADLLRDLVAHVTQEQAPATSP